MKILIADDELVSRTKLITILSGYGECVVSESGKEALAEFNHALDIGAPFDLISLDINMPDISGIDVLKEIRDAEKEKGIKKPSKVIMVTAHADQADVVGSMKAGCNKYVIKPFDPKCVADKLMDFGFMPLGF
jgi:two-component system chemotaxis response regulator CheY